MQSITKIVVNT